MEIEQAALGGMNESPTGKPTGAELTQPCSRSVHMINDFDGPKIRKQLEATRRQYGAESAVGHRCSNLVQQLDNHATAEGQRRKDLEKHIAKSVEDLARLTAR